jgi:uncharacterized protein YcbK (DUF882 family)
MKYKINVYLNRIPTNYNILTDFEKARLYHLKHGVEIDFCFKSVNVKGYISIEHTNPKGFKQYILNGAHKLIPMDVSADTDMFIFDQAEWSTPPGSPFPLKPETPNGSCQIINGKPFISIGAYLADHKSGQTAIQIAHEIMHSYTQNAYLKQVFVQDVMDDYIENNFDDKPTSNFSRQWKLLANYLNVTKYKYFKDSEIIGLKHELVRKLDLAREYADTPFAITSGLRSKEANDKLINAVEDSAHLTGFACEIACTESTKRWKIMQGALQAGFKRIGVGKTFIHLDVDLSKVQNVMWHYY